MKARLVGKHGIATMHLVGGPLDGETKLAVVGAPVVVRVKKRANPAQPAEPSSMIYVSTWTGFPSVVEGDEWKADADAKRKKREGRKYALYLPDVVDGKATGVLRFGGEFMHTEAES